MTQLLPPITKEMPAATHPGTLVLHSRAGGLMGALSFGICLYHPHVVCRDKTRDVSSIWAARTGVIYLICQQSKGQGPVERGWMERSWQHGSRRGNHGQEGSQESPLPIRPFPMTCGVSEFYLMLSSVTFDQLTLPNWTHLAEVDTPLQIQSLTPNLAESWETFCWQWNSCNN